MTNQLIKYQTIVCRRCDKDTLFIYCKICNNSSKTHNIQNPICEYCAVGNKCLMCNKIAYGSCLCCENIICNDHSNLVVDQRYNRDLFDYYKMRGFIFHVACDNCIKFRIPLHGMTETPQDIATDTIANYKT